MLFLVLSPTEDFSSTHITNVFPDTFSIQDFSSTHIINIFPDTFYCLYVLNYNVKLKILKNFSDTHINAFSDSLFYIESFTCRCLHMCKSYTANENFFGTYKKCFSKYSFIL